MIIHAGKYHSEIAPIEIYHVQDENGTVFVGDERGRIMLTREEVVRLYRLLEPFAKPHPVEVFSANGDLKQRD
jgi:hypothetical protein